MDLISSIERRIRQKLADQEKYCFTPLMDSIDRAYLDLTLEYADLEGFSRMVVLMPKIVLGWDVSLYITESDTEAVLAASTLPEQMARLKKGRAARIAISDEPPQVDDGHFIPLIIRERSAPRNPDLEHNPIVGALIVKPGRELGEMELSFLSKYADLLGQSLLHRLLQRKNEQHLAFIRKLVADIGHNVIVPNIFFKAYLRRLYGKIDRLKEIQEQLIGLTQAPPQTLQAGVRDLAAEMANANEGLQEEFDHIEKHYVNTSLFLETLLRQSHFEKGRYVLQKKTCNFRRDVIGPQVDRFKARLKERDIEVDMTLGGVPDQVIEAVVDVGLISQVYANLLSNAVKYTRPVPWEMAERKLIAYGLELAPGAFGPSEDGVKLNLFSTGCPLDVVDRQHIFEEGYRGSNVGRERGTGHGLFFVKEVIELHGGRVGYEPVEKGNNFFFLLPRKQIV